MQDYEKLGQFYLGKQYDFEKGLSDELILYDSKDLTTHAVCVGMTGSGKTGLCLSLIEEALIDQIPVLAIDPKGDLGNLLLTFPDLAPSDFRDWIDEGAATRTGKTPDEYAAQTAELWKNGLAKWGQDGERIRRLRDTVDMAIYTPGSNAGLPLTVLKSFDAPSEAVLNDADAFRERVSSCTSGLLALLGIDADPVRSREHILISNILDRAWRSGKSLDVGGLIMAIQAPAFDKVGVFDLEMFYPQKDRMELAMAMNNLLASPSFQNWMHGDPLDVQRLLYTREGKPRLSVISIAHLSDTERMFFVTILLNEVLAWVRSQEGTTTLRAMLYMDEVFGYFPPVANPPSKAPMLTLLKQARAFGLGVVLATQNPVDLDYKGLANTGTWFLGRLQTERDKARVLEGLEGASAAAGATFDRQKMEATLAALGNRVFLMNNVHEDAPVVFQTRWAMSYLRGPLSREHIVRLMEPRKQKLEPTTSDQPATGSQRPQPAEPEPSRVPTQTEFGDARGPLTEPPALPPEVDAYFLNPRHTPRGAKIRYRPALLGHVRLHFVRSSYDVDAWEDQQLLAAAEGELDDSTWERAVPIELQRLDVDREPWDGAEFEELPGPLTSTRAYASLGKQLKEHCYQRTTRNLWRCENPKMYSQLGEEEGDFRVRLRTATRELRDMLVEKVRAKFSSRMEALESRLRSEQDRLAREQAQYDAAKMDTAVSFGTSILGAIFGRKLTSSRASSSARSAGRAAQQRSDVTRAEGRVQDVERDISDLEAELMDEIHKIEDT
ncbi:MAG: DUF87 domain-containing protein, partial [Planctomycetales bacterium]|nr:DUF87 domain-containing protein [Planctomycetales bacterium]